MVKIKIPYKIIRRPKEEVIDGSISKVFSSLLKGLCCILVGLHHFSRIMVEQNGSTNPFYILLASQGGNVGVGLFFFLSGYGLMESSKRKTLSIKEILEKRFWKLLWPILVVNIIYLGLVRLSIFIPDIGYTKSKNILIDIFSFESIDAVLWFINVLFVCYTIFYISEACRNKYSNIVFYGLGTCYLLFMMFTKPELHWHYTNIPMFFLGSLYSQESRFFVEKADRKHILILFSFLCIATSVGWFGYKIMWARFGVCLMVLIILLWLNLKYEILLQGSDPVSKASYEYYLVHNKILMLWGG